MKIRISDIIINKRLRNIDAARVTSLAGSIREVGLLNPITLTSSNVLVAGAHRVEAYKQLGLTEIEYTILDLTVPRQAYTELEASGVNVTNLLTELAELDENLNRNNLDFLEKGRHLVRRKEIYEQLHPETKASIGKELVAKRIAISNAISAPDTPTFVEDTSLKTGVSKRTIETSIQIAKDIVPEFQEAIKGTDITKTQALAVSRLEPDTQKKVLEEMKTIAQSKFGRSDIVLLTSKEPEIQKEAVSMVTRGDSRTLKEALVKLDLVTSKPDNIEEHACTCGKIIKINWTAHTIED